MRRPFPRRWSSTCRSSRRFTAPPPCPGCATGSYGAPEIWLGEPENASPLPADIYAFGCVAFEVLTAGALAALAFMGVKAIWPIYLIAITFGASRAFLSPSNTALGPMLVPRTLLPRAIAWK